LDAERQEGAGALLHLRVELAVGQPYALVPAHQRLSLGTFGGDAIQLLTDGAAHQGKPRRTGDVGQLGHGWAPEPLGGERRLATSESQAYSRAEGRRMQSRSGLQPPVRRAAFLLTWSRRASARETGGNW